MNALLYWFNKILKRNLFYIRMPIIEAQHCLVDALR